MSDAILDGGLSYEMADDGGSAIWCRFPNCMADSHLKWWTIADPPSE
jgi:hypothetical protein